MFDSGPVFSGDRGVCGDEVGTAFDGFLQTTMLGERSVGVSDGVWCSLEAYECRCSF